jgi:anaerobic sulfite reductase subunit B
MVPPPDALVAPRPAPPPSPAASPMAPWPATVVDRRVETTDTVTLRLAVEGRDLAAACAPGQFCMLWVPGVGESAISLSGIGSSSGGDGTVDHTVKRVGAVTAALCEAQVGDVVGLRGPFGRGWDLTVPDLVVVAGGIGLAPLRSLVRHVLAGAGPVRRLAVLVGFRSPSDVLFATELDDWRRQGADVHVTVDRPDQGRADQGRADGGWDGEVGVVTRLLGRVAIGSASAAAVCGPEVMMRSTGRALVERGVAPSRVQVSLERNMRCGVGHCGHCQLGPLLVCREGPVRRWSDVEGMLEVREL